MKQKEIQDITFDVIKKLSRKAYIDSLIGIREV